MKITKEVKIGIIVLVGIALLYLGINYLKGIAIFSDQRTYYCVYHRIDGVQPSNPIVINGFVVGQVRNVTMLPDTSRSLLLELVIKEKNLHIPKDSKARIQSSGLLGNKEIELQLGSSRDMAQNGDTLETSVETGLMESVNKEILPLKLKTEQLISDIDSIITIFQVILDEETRTDLTKSLGSIRTAIQSLEITAFRLDTLVKEEKVKLSSIFSHIESISGNLEANNKEISNIIQNFSSLSDSLMASNIKSVVNNASGALKEVNEITGKINRGEGTMGMLINNDSLYNRLSSASNQLDLLLEDIRINPDRYVKVSVFGKSKSKKVELSRKDIETLREQLREDLKEDLKNEE